jgi:hypothetical protein
MAMFVMTAATFADTSGRWRVCRRNRIFGWRRSRAIAPGIAALNIFRMQGVGAAVVNVASSRS